MRLPAMRYAELPLPPELTGKVRTVWSLDCGADAVDLLRQKVIPDGCIELIRRIHGRSIWKGEQPPLFAGGLLSAPVDLQFSGDARFVGIRFWPWAWAELGGAPCPGFLDDWIAINSDHPLGKLLDRAELLPDSLLAAFAKVEDASIGRHILASATVAELTQRSGFSHRRLQRWFAASIGLPPQRYLRLLRFQDTLGEIQRNGGTLADHAAARGYADQAHMARDFREIVGVSASTARSHAQGPFL